MFQRLPALVAQALSYSSCPGTTEAKIICVMQNEKAEEKIAGGSRNPGNCGHSIRQSSNGLDNNLMLFYCQDIQVNHAILAEAINQEGSQHAIFDQACIY